MCFGGVQHGTGAECSCKVERGAGRGGGRSAPREEVDVDEGVLAVDEVQVVRHEHNGAHHFGHRAQHDDCTHTTQHNT